MTDSGEPAPPPPTPAELQPHFPQLEILRLVGRGGMGAVYEARQKGLARSVALKILAAPKSADSSFEERFVREAQALARLSHENIVAVFDAGRAGPHFFLSMEYVDGPNLRQAERAGHIEPAQALAIVMQICTALDYAHKNGIVHRDIKPENVLLTRDGRVKIVDFGLAKVLDRAARGLSLTRMSQTMGTPHYMAPEQIEHPKDVDHRADIYSLGVVFYELLTGELPLGRFPLPSQKVQIDVRLDDIVIRTLEKEPERRYQAASEVGTALQGVASSPMRVAPGTAGLPTRPSRVYRSLAIAAAVLVLVWIGVFAVVLLSGRGDESMAVHLEILEGEARARALVVDELRSAQPAADGNLRTIVLRDLVGPVRGEPAYVHAAVVNTVLDLAVPGGPEDPLRRYEEHEIASTTKLALRDTFEVAAVRVETNGALVRELRDELAAQLREQLRGYDISLGHIDRIVEQHMAFESGAVELRVKHEGRDAMWVVDRYVATTYRGMERFEVLPRRYRRLVDLYQRDVAAPTPAAPTAPRTSQLPSIATNALPPAFASNPGSASESDPARLIEPSQHSSERAPLKTSAADPDPFEDLRPTYTPKRGMFGDMEEAFERASPRDRARALDAMLALPDASQRIPELQTYLEHEASRTTFLPLSSANEVAALRIDPDPAVVAEFRTKFRERLEEPGSSKDLSLRPEDVDWLVREHMPFDEGPVEIHIALEGSHWAVGLTLPPRSDLTPAHSASKLARKTSRTFSELPVAYRRLIARQRESLGSEAPPWPDGRNPLAREFAPIPDAPRGPRVPSDLARAWNAAREELMTTGVTILEEYWRAESQCTSNRKPGGDHEVANVHIDAFPATRYVLAEAIWRCLELDGFRKEDIALLRENDFALAVLPFGDQAYDVSIEGLEEGWKATTRAENGLSSTTFGMPELQEPFARLLRRFRGATTEPR